MPKRNYFFVRLLVVFVVHLIFKVFDLSFTSALEPSLRSLGFSIFFMIYWMGVWEVARWIYRKQMGNWIGKPKQYGKLTLVSTVILIFAVLTILIYNYWYLLSDYFIFGNTWNDIAVLNPEIMGDFTILKSLRINPELFYGLFLFIILAYGVIIFIELFNHVKEMEVSTALLQHENTHAKYQALKNQIDPHFFFNSLSVLSSLVHEDPGLSSTYISHLSKLYRNILESDTDRLITLQEELAILESYTFLLRIRFHEAFQLHIELSEASKNQVRVVPHVMQMLIENALKHNSFSADEPIDIYITENSDSLIVRNALRAKRLLQRSTHVGLSNIKNRYAIASESEVEVSTENGEFIVKLPKITHEYSDNRR